MEFNFGPVRREALWTEFFVVCKGKLKSRRKGATLKENSGESSSHLSQDTVTTGKILIKCPPQKFLHTLSSSRIYNLLGWRSKCCAWGENGENRFLAVGFLIFPFDGCQAGFIASPTRAIVVFIVCLLFAELHSLAWSTSANTFTRLSNSS